MIKLLHASNESSHNTKQGLRAALKTAAAAIVSVATLGTMAIAGVGMASAQEESVTLPQPQAEKTVSANDDGTYKMTLSVTGQTAKDSSQKVTPADIVLVVDKSRSMKGNRFTTVKTAATNLADKLLTEANKQSGNVRMSVVTFETSARKASDWTTDSSAVANAIGGQPQYNDRDYVHGGTNWDDAFEKANAAEARNNAAKYIVFLSDGLPTFRNDAGSRNGVAGNGHDDRDGRNYAAAVEEANKRGNAALYSVSADEAANEAMQNLANATNGKFFDGSDSAKLNDAFDSIYQEIVSSAAYRNVVISDTLSQYVDFVKANGTPTFTLTKSNDANWNGPAPKFDGKNVVWDLGDTELEQGVTYTLTVTLTPTQEAFDKAVENGEESQLPSNDAATVNYKVATKINGEEQTPVNGTPFQLAPGSITAPVSNITIKKVWAKGAPEKTVTVQLLQNGKQYGKNITLSKASKWQADVIVPAGLEDYTWSVKELSAGKGYTAAVDPGEVTFKGGQHNEATFTVTNSYKAEVVPSKPADTTKTDTKKPVLSNTGVAVAGIAAVAVLIAAVGGVALAIRRRNA